MSNSADDILNSLKGGLEANLPKRSGDAKTHETGAASITFVLTGGCQHSFPYTYLRSSRHTKEGITVKTGDAIITIKGSHLESIYSFIRRQKISEIALSQKHEKTDQQAFVEFISIHYIDEEITYE
ncbi:MAG: hypothetical protein SV765_00255 [Pseudomonadota bacterium]|nr:hypothetical protein [Pseudomonadota bacterium]